MLQVSLILPQTKAKKLGLSSFNMHGGYLLCSLFNALCGGSSTELNAAGVWGGVVKIGHVATILVILGPMAAFFGPMQTFSAILRSVTIIFGPEVILSAILGSVTTLFGPGVTLSATLRSLGPFRPSTGP